MVGVRVSQEWKEEIEAIAQRSGRTSSQVFYEAIALYLGKDEAQTLANQVKELSARVALLENQQQGLRMLLSR